MGRDSWVLLLLWLRQVLIGGSWLMDAVIVVTEPSAD